MDTESIIKKMREEAEGDRGVFYENFGSAIHPALGPLSKLLDASKEQHPELVSKVARALYSGAAVL